MIGRHQRPAADTREADERAHEEAGQGTAQIYGGPSVVAICLRRATHEADCGSMVAISGGTPRPALGHASVGPFIQRLNCDKPLSS